MVGPRRFYAQVYAWYLNIPVLRNAATEDELLMCALASIPNIINQVGMCNNSVNEVEAKLKEPFPAIYIMTTIMDNIIQDTKTASSNSIQTWQPSNFLQFQHDMAVRYRKNKQNDRPFCSDPAPFYW